MANNKEEWIGKLCVFWNDIGDKPTYGIFDEVSQDDFGILYVLYISPPEEAAYFRHCRPLTLEEAKRLILQPSCTICDMAGGECNTSCFYADEAG